MAWRGIFSLLLTLLAVDALAEEPALGRVLSVDPDTGMATLSLEDAGDAGPRELTLPLWPGNRVEQGDLLRVWPDSRVTDERAGEAERMRVGPLHPIADRRDPTGVRSRLMRGPGRDAGRGPGRGGRGGR